MGLFVAGQKAPNFIDKSGQKLGKLLIVERDLTATTTNAKWKCVCDCGKELSITSNNLLRQRSCGCDRKTTTTHGMSGTKEFRAWASLLDRCTNQSNKKWADYGGRGIAVCEEWAESFSAFFSCVGEAPSKEHSIDRINVNGNYEPGNVRWASRQEQARNKRNSVYIDGDHLINVSEKTGLDYKTLMYRVKNGVDINKPPGRDIPIHANGKTMSLTEWSKHLGVKKTTLAMRYRVYGWSADKTFREPQHG